MLFSSVTFLVYFLPAVICLYYMAPARLKNLVLLVASLFFYAWGEPVYIFLMLVSIIFNYASGFAIEKARNKKRSIHFVMTVNAIVNLGLLGFFKYGNFLIENINTLLSMDLESMDLSLPIGISFYTFQAMSYAIDLSRGKVRIQKNLLDFAVYICLFPQLIAGPIVRFKTVEEQLQHRTQSFELFAQGIVRFVFGLAKKVIIANNVGQIWSIINEKDIADLSVMSVWIAAFAFSLQIYFDFSGYSDMAIGLGKMFGFKFDENFNYPYVSRSITEFWRRWHISLGTWFKEYVYIPLGGNKAGIVRQIFNILIVWSLTGLWHGASWNFAIWGTYFGFFLVMEKLIIGKVLDSIVSLNAVLGTLIARVYTLLVVGISWLIFSVEESNRLIAMLKIMFGFGDGNGVVPNSLYEQQDLYLLGSNVAVLLLAFVAASGLPKNIYVNIVNNRVTGGGRAIEVYEIVLIFVLYILSFSFIVASTYNPFLYFRF